MGSFRFEQIFPISFYSNLKELLPFWKVLSLLRVRVVSIIFSWQQTVKNIKVQKLNNPASGLSDQAPFFGGNAIPRRLIAITKAKETSVSSRNPSWDTPSMGFVKRTKIHAKSPRTDKPRKTRAAFRYMTDPPFGCGNSKRYLNFQQQKTGCENPGQGP